MNEVIGENEGERAESEGITRRIADKIWHALRYGEDVIVRLD